LAISRRQQPHSPSYARQCLKTESFRADYLAGLWLLPSCARLASRGRWFRHRWPRPDDRLAIKNGQKKWSWRAKRECGKYASEWTRAGYYHNSIRVKSPHFQEGKITPFRIGSYSDILERSRFFLVRVGLLW
jgi:hypothetical protein